MTRFSSLRQAVKPVSRVSAMERTSRIQRTSLKISKFKKPSSISCTARSILQGGLSKPPAEQKKSVRFRMSELSRSQQEDSEKNTENVKTETKLNSQVGDDFVFEEDADALASILNNDGISHDLLRKSQSVQNELEGKSADEFLLVDGRPSLCRRVPINRSSSILPDGSRASLISSRVSVGPGRILRPSVTGRPSFSVRRGSSIRPGAQDQLLSLIERRYSQRNQDDVFGHQSLQHGKASTAKLAVQQPSRLEATKKFEPRRVLSIKRQNVNVSTPLGRSARTTNPLCSPALRVAKSVKKTPGKSCVVDEKSPKLGILETVEEVDNFLEGNIVTALNFQDEENQSPNVNLAPQTKLADAKPKRSISRMPVVQQRQSFLKKPANYQRPRPAAQKSFLLPRNSDRYYLASKCTSKPKQKDSIKTVSVEAKLHSGEELVKPKVLNYAAQLEADPKVTENEPRKSAGSRLAKHLPQNEKYTRAWPRTTESMPQPSAINTLQHEKYAKVAQKPPQHKSSALKFCNTRALNDPKKGVMQESNVSMLSSCKNNETFVASKKSRLPTFGLRPKRNVVQVEDVLNLMQKKLAAIKRRSVQAEFSSVLESVQMSLTSVAETVEDQETSELKSAGNEPRDDRPSPVLREKLQRPSANAVAHHQQTRTGEEALSVESSPTWKDVLGNRRDHSDEAGFPNQRSSDSQASKVVSVKSSPTWKDVLESKGDHSDKFEAPEQQQRSDAQAVEAGQAERRINEDIVEAAAEKMKIERELEKLKLEKEKLQESRAITEKLSLSKMDLFTAKPKDWNSDLFATQKRIENIINSKVPPPTPRPFLAQPKYFAAVVSPDEASELSVSHTSPESLNHKSIASHAESASAQNSADPLVKFEQLPNTNRIPHTNSDLGVQKAVYWTEKTPKPSMKFQSVLENPKVQQTKTLVVDRSNESKTFAGIDTGGIQNAVQWTSKTPIPSNNKDCTQECISNGVPKRVTENRETKSVRWADNAQLDLNTAPITEPGNNHILLCEDSPNVIKPKSADSMVWRSTAKENKISSGRIGLKSNSVVTENSPVLSEKCPITLVISPKLEAIKIANSPVPRENLATLPSFAAKGLLASPRLEDSPESFALRPAHDSPTQDFMRNSPHFKEKTSSKFAPSLAQTSAISKLTQGTESSVQAHQGLQACPKPKEVANCEVSNWNIFDHSTVRHHRHYGLTASTFEENDPELLKFSENCSKTVDFQVGSPKTMESLGNLSQAHKFAENCMETLLPSPVTSKLTRNSILEQLDLPSLQSLQVVGLEVQKKSTSENYNMTLEQGEVCLPSGNSMLGDLLELERIGEPLPNFDTTREKLDQNENFVSSSKVESNEESKSFSHSCLQRNTETKVAAPTKGHEDTKNAGAQKYNKEASFENVIPSMDDVETKDTTFSRDRHNESLKRFFESLTTRSNSSGTHLSSLLDSNLESIEVPQLSVHQSGPPLLSDVPLVPARDSNHADNEMPMENSCHRTLNCVNKTAAFSIQAASSPSYQTFTRLQKLENETSNFCTALGLEPETSNESQPAAGLVSFNEDSAPVVSKPLPFLAVSSGQMTAATREPVEAAMEDLMNFSADVVEPSLFSGFKPKQVLSSFDRKEICQSAVMAAPKAIKPPPPQTPAAFRMIRQRLRESPTPKKIHPRSLLSMQSPSRGIRKTPQKKSKTLTSSPSIRLVGSKRFKEALLDEEVAILTCVRFRTSSAVPDDRTLKRSAMNPLGRVLMDGDDTHFVPISPIAASKKRGGKDAVSGSAFSAFRHDLV